MSELNDISAHICAARQQGKSLRIIGGNSKAFLGEPVSAEDVLDVSRYAGVIDYRPEELMLRAKAGTRIETLNALLLEAGQKLSFEPPVHASSATLGGLVSAGLSGSSRPWAGALRDHVLGVGLILQDGAYREFGGQVMKNVAGYDVSRLVCGAHGTLGVIADISLKVLPAPISVHTTRLQLGLDAARKLVSQLRHEVSPLSASCYASNELTLRFSGSETAVEETSQSVGGEPVDNGFWQALDTQQLDLFLQAKDVWRLSTHPDEPMFDQNFAVMDWAFGQRWLLDPARNPRVDYPGHGHWTRWRVDPDGFDAPVFQPLGAVSLPLHQRLKQAFDEHRLFNPGRLSAEI